MNSFLNSFLDLKDQCPLINEMGADLTIVEKPNSPDYNFFLYLPKEAGVEESPELGASLLARCGKCLKCSKFNLATQSLVELRTPDVDYQGVETSGLASL